MNVVIEKFKKKTKDPFVMAALNTQAVNNYLFIWFLQENCHESLLKELMNINIYLMSDEKTFAISRQMSVSWWIQLITAIIFTPVKFGRCDIVTLSLS